MKPDIVRRYAHNPILTKAQIPYPVETVHNAGVAKHEDEYIMLFRSHLRTGRSIIGLARSPDMVSILLGNGDGTFQSHVDYATGTKPSSVTSGDFNGDKTLDLAVASGIGVSVLLGNGDGTFQAHVDYATGTGGLPPQDVFITSVITADFNSDGKLDLAVANAAPQEDFMPGSVSILLGNGDGTFRAHVDTPVVSPFSLATADLNGDGKLDLATADWTCFSEGSCGEGNVSILLGMVTALFNLPSVMVSALLVRVR